MIAFSNQSNLWLFRYRCYLAIAGLCLFFTRLDAFLHTNQIFSSPVGFYLPFFMLSIPIFLLNRLKYPLRNVLLWGVGYLGLSSISYLLLRSSEYSLDAILTRTFSTTFLVLMTLLLAEPRIFHRARCTLAGIVVISVLNNFYQFLNPSSFGGLVEGRAVGTYLDPNDCASAIILGMILTITLFPQKLRIPWVLLAGFGVALTLSRGGGLLWIITVFLMCFLRVIHHKQAVWWTLGGSIFLISFMSLGGDSIDSIAKASGEAFGRIESILNGSTLGDGSSLERQGIAKKAWTMFLERPLSGHGIGAAANPYITGYTVSTHNMYVLHLAEYGIWGLPILPLAIFSVVHTARYETRKIGIIFCLFILLASFFSHTILDLSPFLISFALMAVTSEMSRSSALEIHQ